MPYWLTSALTTAFARLDDNDQLVFHQAGVLPKSKELASKGVTDLKNESPIEPISGRRLFPFGDGFLYQSGTHYVLLNKHQQIESINEVPIERGQLVDVSHDGEQLLFVRFERQSAQIIALF